jgi:8-oxo-dGTP diphosphatase/8-oxo-dGTP diphosphatase/2-hydroxy-dATP diphosphatase
MKITRDSWEEVKEATVVLLEDGDGKIALARKKQPIHHDSGVIEYSLGRYNGYGGKKEKEDTTIFATAVRELYDESGVIAREADLTLALRVYFSIKGKNELKEPFMIVSFFVLRTWEGIPVEGSEMGPPTFFDRESIPFEEMMPADKLLFEKIFAGEYGVYDVYLPGKHEAPVLEKLDEEL